MVQVEKFKKNLEGKIVPDHILKIVEEEINKYMMLDIGHSESSVTWTYLDILTSLPYGLSSDENYNIEDAEKILDDSHYGMKDVKDRILEFIAVG